MALNLTFINAALTRTGNDPVTVVNDGTPGGNIAGQNYDLLVKTALTSYPWRWATKTQTLVSHHGRRPTRRGCTPISFRPTCCSCAS
jgi:hypothetical protein